MVLSDERREDRETHMLVLGALTAAGMMGLGFAQIVLVANAFTKAEEQAKVKVRVRK